MTWSSRQLQGLAASFLLLLCLAPFPAAAQSKATDVSLTIDGKPAAPGDYKPAAIQSLVVGNGLLQISFGKDVNGDFSGTSVIKDGKELAHNLHGVEPRDVDARRTFYLDYGAGRGHLEAQIVRVVKNTPELAHFAVIDNRPDATHLEHHFVMLKGESGIHPWVLIDTRSGAGGGGEMRTMYRFDKNIMNMTWTNERTGEQPTYASLQAISEIGNVQDETWKFPDGSIYQKYDYSIFYKDSPMWGHYGHGFGAFLIPVSVASYAGGPLRQELAVHQDALILNYIGGGHYGGGGTAAGTVNGVKIHGPYYLYVNSGADDKAVIDDALKTAAAEKAKWPYKFVEDEANYPTHLTTVTGTIRVADGRSAAKAEVVLAKPGGDVYRQGGDFIFYAQADDKGAFKIDNVRPGTYTAYVWANQGTITQQEVKDGLVVKGDKTDVGEILWSPPHHNKLLWQIGESDHLTDGFKFSNELRNIKWIGMVPANLTYTVGKSKTDDWYYAQGKIGKWNVVFNVDKAPDGKCYLSIGKCGQSNDPDITVQVNGKEATKLRFNSESATYRAAMRTAHYQNDTLEFPASMLKQGENTLTFSLNSIGEVTASTGPGGLMWDTIILESD